MFLSDIDIVWNDRGKFSGGCFCSRSLVSALVWDAVSAPSCLPSSDCVIPFCSLLSPSWSPISLGFFPILGRFPGCLPADRDTRGHIVRRFLQETSQEKSLFQNPLVGDFVSLAGCSNLFRKVQSVYYFQRCSHQVATSCGFGLVVWVFLITLYFDQRSAMKVP